ncbi:3507_t:CDS:2 [Cetraspora pellucida]|uniref:3507_t:CDS:1 n=1 Tax=Cetraspora pellucida TaxID=1433469 RepID=A0ACA9KYD4_9GLOM|nr:3507_t:CDS:2 [Cetraspora pellucida]
MSTIAGVLIEKFEDQDTQARMFFLDGDPVVELFVIPEDIEVRKINETTNRVRSLIFFLEVIIL